MATELGISIDSSGMKPGLADLDSVVQKSQAAEQAATKMGQTVSGAMKQAGQGTSEVAAGLKATADNAGAAADGVTKAANAHAGLSTQGQAALHSVRGLVEQLAMGIPPTQALTSHINQLSYAASGQGGLTGAFSEAGSMIGRLITPTTALIGGVAAVGAGAYLAVENWKNFGIKLDDTAHIAGTTVEEMSKLQAAASFKGISADAFQSGIEKFSAGVYEAQNGVGQLAAMLRANGESAKDFGGYMDAAANIIQRASSDQERLQLLQQMGLPATEQWVRLLSGGAKGLRDAQAAAADFGTGTDDLVKRAREFDETWNKAWTNFGLHARAGIQNVIKGIEDLPINKISALISLVSNPGGVAGNVVGGYINRLIGGNDNSQTSKQGASGSARASAGGGDVVDPAILQKNNALLQQRVSILGASASLEDRMREAENAITLARINGVDVSKSEQETILGIARESAEAAQNQFRYVQQLRTEYGGVSASTAQILANLEAQSGLANAVTGQDQIDAQYQATIAQLLLQGKDEREASLIAAQQMANAEDAVDASVERQVRSLKQQTELIKARADGNEAAVAAAQAYQNAIDAGASSTEASALESATLQNYMARAEASAGGLARNMGAAAANIGAAAAGMSSLDQALADSNNFGAGSKGEVIGSAPRQDTLNPGSDASNIPGYGSGVGYSLSTAGFQSLADQDIHDGKGLSQALADVMSLRDKFSRAGSIYGAKADAASAPVIASLQQQMAALTNATQANTTATNSLTQGMDSIYSGGHSALAIGYYGEGEKTYNYDPNGFFRSGSAYTAPAQPYDPNSGGLPVSAPSGGGSTPMIYTGTVPSVPGFADGGTIEPYSLAYVGEHSPSPRLIRAGAEPIIVTPNVPDTTKNSTGTVRQIVQNITFITRSNDLGDRRTRRQVADGYGNSFRAVI